MKFSLPLLKVWLKYLFSILFLNVCEYKFLNLGQKYELYNLVKEHNHSAVQLKFNGMPGKNIVGKWSPDYSPEAGCIKKGNTQASTIANDAVKIRPIQHPQPFGTVEIDVEPISQHPEFPSGCEATSAVMVLHFYDYGISVKNFIDQHLICKKAINGGLGPDPYSVFAGSPYSVGYGCFSPVIVKAMNKVLKGARAEIVHGKPTLSNLAEEYLKKGIPVLIWATIGMKKTYDGHTSWTINYSDNSALIGKQHKWKDNEHCVVLLGFNEKDYFVNDPYQTAESVRGAYEKNLLQQRYEDMGSQAIIVRQGSTTISSIDQEKILKLGVKGEEVRYLQNMLLSIGYDLGPSGADGIFGKKTEAAICTLQRNNSLVADGKVGPQTVKTICKLVPHKLPEIGEPNSVGRQYGENGELVRERIYGPDGRAQKDLDYTDHGNPKEHPDVPHQHDWDWSKEPKDRRSKEPKPVDAEKDGVQSNEFHLSPEIANSLFVAGSAVGVGYVIYRGVRMLPSMLPPLWWTIPGNLAIP